MSVLQNKVYPETVRLHVAASIGSKKGVGTAAPNINNNER